MPHENTTHVRPGISRDDIIRMARDAGSIDSDEVIETLYNAFSAAEREACAKLIEQYTGTVEAPNGSDPVYEMIDAIRSRQ